MIAVGLFRWFLNMQREEIQLLFFGRGIEISTGEISNLSEEFLLRFYALHKRHNKMMKSIFEKKGGMILHLDGTGEAGDDIVFTAIDGITGIKIDSQIMPSESKETIKPFLSNIKKYFGNPIVVIRDMSKNIKEAASEVFDGVLHLICHYHFVANMGKLIFKEEYELLRNNIVKTRILAQFGYLKEKLSELNVYHNILVQAELKWAEIAIEHIIMPRERRSGFPFILPYYEIIIRAIEIKKLLKKIIDWNAENKMAVSSVLEFYEKIEKLVMTEDVKKHFLVLEKVWNWFEAVRKILDVSRHLKDEKQITDPKTAADLKNDLRKLIEQIKKDCNNCDVKINSISKIIISECTEHWDELTREIKDKNGCDVNIFRHNGIAENNHRWSRMHTRRRTGRSRTTNDMAKYGALTAILSNLENEIYTKEVLADVEDFVYEILSVTEDEIKEAKKLIKPYHNEYLVSSDPKRITILTDFIKLLEQNEENKNVDVKGWLDQVEKSNGLMTP
jgi:hypothetical protein